MLYYIDVKQNRIRKEAYDYFVNLQRNIEQAGSISLQFLRKEEVIYLAYQILKNG